MFRPISVGHADPTEYLEQLAGELPAGVLATGVSAQVLADASRKLEAERASASPELKARRAAGMAAYQRAMDRFSGR